MTMSAGHCNARVRVTRSVNFFLFFFVYLFFLYICRVKHLKNIIMEQLKNSQSVSVKSDSLNRGCNKKTSQKISIDNIFALYEQNNVTNRESFLFRGTRSQILNYLIEHFNEVSLSSSLKVAFDSHFFSVYSRSKMIKAYRSDLSYFKDNLPHKIGFTMVPIAFMFAQFPAKFKHSNFTRYFYTYLEMI